MKFRLDPVAPVTSASAPGAAMPPFQPAGLCKDGNMEHCKTMCDRGVQPACNRL